MIPEPRALPKLARVSENEAALIRAYRTLQPAYQALLLDLTVRCASKAVDLTLAGGQRNPTFPERSKRFRPVGGDGRPFPSSSIPLLDTSRDRVATCY
jgi:hypothetical protein